MSNKRRGINRVLLSQRVPRTGNGRGRFGRDQQREDQPQQSCLLQTNEREKEGGTVDGVSKAKSKTMQNKQTSVGGGGGREKRERKKTVEGRSTVSWKRRGFPGGVGGKLLALAGLRCRSWLFWALRVLSTQPDHDEPRRGARGWGNQRPARVRAPLASGGR